MFALSQVNDGMFNFDNVSKLFHGLGGMPAFQVFFSHFDVLAASVASVWVDRDPAFVRAALAYIVNNREVCLEWARKNPIYPIADCVRQYCEKDMNVISWYSATGVQVFHIHGIPCIKYEDKIIPIRPAMQEVVRLRWVHQRRSHTMDVNRVLSDPLAIDPYVEESPPVSAEITDTTMNNLWQYVKTRGYSGSLLDLATALTQGSPIRMETHFDNKRDWHRSVALAPLLVLNPRARILDVGGGDGSQAESILSLYPQCTVHIVDPHVGITPPPEGETRLLNANIIHPGPSYVEWCDGQYDIIHMNMTMHHVREPWSDFFRSIARLLAPGGVVVVRDHDITTPERRGFCQLLHQFWRQAGQHNEMCDEKYHSHASMRSAAETCGFAMLDVPGVSYGSFLPVGGKVSAYIQYFVHPQYFIKPGIIPVYVAAHILSHQGNPMLIGEVSTKLNVPPVTVQHMFDRPYGFIFRDNKTLKLPESYVQLIPRRVHSRPIVKNEEIISFGDRLVTVYGKMPWFVQADVCRSFAQPDGVFRVFESGLTPVVIIGLYTMQGQGHIEYIPSSKRWYWTQTAAERYGTAFLPLSDR